MPSLCFRKLYSSLGKQDDVLHRECVWSGYLDCAPSTCRFINCVICYLFATTVLLCLETKTPYCISIVCQCAWTKFVTCSFVSM